MMKTWIWTLLLLAAATIGSAQQDIPISGLPTGSPMQPTDMVPIARSGFNYKLLGSDILAQMNSVDPSGACQLGRIAANTVSNVFFICYGGSWHSIGGAAGAWGGITGTLSNQTDLQNALNLYCLLTGCTMSGAIQAPDGFGSAYKFTNGGSAGLFHSAGTYLVGKDGSGTDQNGELTTIATGKGTGAGNGGQFNLTVYEPSTSGASPQAGQNVIQISGANGSVALGNLQVLSGPAASTFTGVSIKTGQTDTAGASLSLRGGAGTGTGNGGDIILFVAPPATSTGSTPNTWQTVLQGFGSTGAINIGAVPAPSPANSTWQGANATGSNTAGGNVIVKGGAATNGNAAGGDVTVQGGAGIGSGLQGYFRPDPRTFANLGTPTNGAVAYCSDCTIANPCAGSGTGALAKRLAGVWVCN